MTPERRRRPRGGDAEIAHQGPQTQAEDSGSNSQPHDTERLRLILGDSRARARSAQRVLRAVHSDPVGWDGDLLLPEIVSLLGRVALDLSVLERDLDLERSA